MIKTLEKKADVQNGIKRMIFAMMALLLEATVIFIIINKMNQNAEWLAIGTRIFAGILVLVIYSQHKTSTMKTPWIILILVLPIFGCSLFLLVGIDGATKKMRARYKKIDDILLPYLIQNQEVLIQLDDNDKSVANISRYLYKYSGYPVYRNTDIQYFDIAIKAIEDQKYEMKKAKKFIFMEYHAIEDAESWHQIQEILEERVKAGVDVRVFYDDMGSIRFINTDFVKRLEAKGISCRVFNPFIPGLNIFLNNRDHRKITVIDGIVGFTGGYNIANEYFNIVQPYGYWKDTGIKIIGEAVNSLTITFLEMWNAVREKDIDDVRIEQYINKQDEKIINKGYIQPYADSPMDDEHIGENVYISIVEQAKEYVWFVTPYLILTDEMIFALGMAAKRGIDVRIITPGIPDKKIIYSVTRSYYNALARNGVKIYEYTPGFCHCKMCVSDNKIAVCGTINLDYRSLYHHFENGCLYYACKAVYDTKKDFDDILAQCNEVTEQYKSGRTAVLRLGQMVLRLFAPLM